MSYIKPVIDAFKAKKIKKISNTESTGKQLLLFSNVIAEWKNNEIWITTCGWKTVTTRDRLQILGANLYVKKGIWYLNDTEWDGNWIEISSIPKIKEKTSIKVSMYD
jgi:hypothetical protein